MVCSLYFQCDGVFAEFVCTALAEVYYAAVRAFGGGDATPDARKHANPDLVAIYDEKVRLYEEAVQKAKDEGLIPA